jgi:hypothetical protein
MSYRLRRSKSHLKNFKLATKSSVCHLSFRLFLFISVQHFRMSRVNFSSVSRLSLSSVSCLSFVCLSLVCLPSVSLVSLSSLSLVFLTSFLSAYRSCSRSSLYSLNSVFVFPTLISRKFLHVSRPYIPSYLSLLSHLGRI